MGDRINSSGVDRAGGSSAARRSSNVGNRTVRAEKRPRQEGAAASSVSGSSLEDRDAKRVRTEQSTSAPVYGQLHEGHYVDLVKGEAQKDQYGNPTQVKSPKKSKRLGSVISHEDRRVSARLNPDLGSTILGSGMRGDGTRASARLNDGLDEPWEGVFKHIADVGRANQQEIEILEEGVANGEIEIRSLTREVVEEVVGPLADEPKRVEEAKPEQGQDKAGLGNRIGRAIAATSAVVGSVVAGSAPVLYSSRVGANMFGKAFIRAISLNTALKFVAFGGGLIVIGSTVYCFLKPKRK